MARKTKNERERSKSQVETTRERHGDDFYSRIAKEGSKNIPTKFNSKTGSRAAKIRWEKYREQQRRQAKDTQEQK